MAYCGERVREFNIGEEITKDVCLVAGIGTGLIFTGAFIGALTQISGGLCATIIISGLVFVTCIAIRFYLIWWPKLRTSGNRAFDRHQVEERERLEYEKEVFEIFLKSRNDDEDQAIFDKFIKTR